MASEANELTFVRCPTCRSLVPASAARCRICNASLEAKQNNDEEASQQTEQTGRVRQRTVSASPEEVEAIAAGVSESSSENDTAAADTSSVDDGFDPLGAFLDELDAGESDNEESMDPFDPVAEETSVPDSNVEPLDSTIQEQVSEHLFDEEPASSHGNPSEEQVVASVKDVPKPAPERRPAKNYAESANTEEKNSASSDQESSRRGAQLAPRGVKPRFGGKLQRKERDNRDRSRKKRPGANQPAKPPRAVDSGDARVEEKHRPDQEVNKKANKQSQGTHGNSVAVPPNSSPHERAAEGNVTDHVESPSKRGKVRAGRLSGWLVSYENRDGRAIELRAGRFFITGSSIRDSDLILEDQSMSTPHALVSITDKGLLIQDLMSERGTFIRSQGDAQYRREESVIEVNHGDWIRFGDVEFLVVLVPE